jgi:hypothetical protein
MKISAVEAEIILCMRLALLASILCMRLALLVLSISTRLIVNIMQLIFLPRLPRLQIALLTSPVPSWTTNS